MRLKFFVAAAAMLSASLAARADSTFDFSFGTAAAAFSGSGVFTASLESPGVYLIDSATGSVLTGGDHSITLLPVGTFPTATNGGFTPPNDNLLDDTNGFFSLDGNGVSFLLSNGAQIDLYGQSGEILERANGDVVTESTGTSITPTSVTPEPSSFLLLGTGLLCLAGVVRKRFAHV